MEPEDDVIEWVAVPFDAIKALDEVQRWCRKNWDADSLNDDTHRRHERRIDAIDNFLDVREVKTALEVHS